MLETPVALTFFKRPETTERVFRAIARAKPRKLFLIADGPRPDRPGEAEACAATREVVSRIDWDCEVVRNYSDVNLGCGLRPATGITWLFEQVEEAIILEDDCVPDPTFFRYCEELLRHYRDDERVMIVSGTNNLMGRMTTPYSYWLSRIPHCGAWATWRRAWRHFDMKMTFWPKLRETNFLREILGDEEAAAFFSRVFDRALERADDPRIDFWDYQWLFACWAQNGFTIVPAVNIVSNIGFGDHGTHHKDPDHPYANLPTTPMEFPLRHPPHLVRHVEVDLMQLGPLPKPKRSLYRNLRGRLARYGKERLGQLFMQASQRAA